MPPKEKLGKEEIVAGAFELLRQNGIEGLNARGLAAYLGCSTMPLFRQFGSMEEIRVAAIERAIDCYNGYIRKGLEEPLPFKGVGKAYIRFAKEEPRLFELFFMSPKGKYHELPEADPNYETVASTASKAVGGTCADGERIYREMWIFVHGIATLVVLGTMEFEEEEIGEMLSDVFGGLRRGKEEKKDE